MADDGIFLLPVPGSAAERGDEHKCALPETPRTQGVRWLCTECDTVWTSVLVGEIMRYYDATRLRPSPFGVFFWQREQPRERRKRIKKEGQG